MRLWLRVASAGLLLCAVAAAVASYELPQVPAGGLFFIDGSKSKHEVLRLALKERGWRETKRGISYGFKVHRGRHRLCVADECTQWTWSKDRLGVPSSRALLNHFGNFPALCTKSGLLASLRASAGGGVDEFVPRAYLSDSEMGAWRADFVATIAACNASSGDSAQPSLDCGPVAQGALWIAKPSEGTRGVGIAVFDQEAALSQFVAGRNFVVQKYAERPLLVFGRKVDLRQFVLVTSLDPLVVLMSDDCYVRFSSVAYNESDMSEFVHLTNHQVQKLAPLPDGDEARDIHHNQWSLDALRAHMGPGVWEARVKPQLQRLVARTVAAWPQRAQYHRDNSFELLGFDILLDRDYRPWLLEVNSDPGLHLLTKVVNAHHTRAVRDLLSAVMERRADWQGAPPNTCLLLGGASEAACDTTHAPTVGVWRMILKTA